MGGCANTDIHSEKAEVDTPIQTCAKTLTKTHTQGRVNIKFFYSFAYYNAFMLTQGSSPLKAA